MPLAHFSLQSRRRAAIYKLQKWWNHGQLVVSIPQVDSTDGRKIMARTQLH
jgi:hypothetical protein